MYSKHVYFYEITIEENGKLYVAKTFKKALHNDEKYNYGDLEPLIKDNKVTFYHSRWNNNVLIRKIYDK